MNARYITAFSGHAVNCLRSYWPLLGWCLVARIGAGMQR
jgi:hypothetical protein